MNHIIRTSYLRFLMKHRGAEYVKVLHGLRGSGKASLLMDFAVQLAHNNIPQDRILITNFTDPGVPRDAREIYNGIISRLVPGKEFILILNEAQLLPGFEHLVDQLFLMGNIDIYLSGSGSGPFTPLLSKLLPGRVISKEIYPLSLAEFTAGKKLDGERLQEYLSRSTLPGINEHLPALRELDGAVSAAVLHDALSLSSTLRPVLLEKIIHYMAQHTGELISLTQMAKELGRAGRPLLMKSVKSYLNALEKSGLLISSPLLALPDGEGSTVAAARMAGRYYFKDPAIAALYAPMRSPMERLYLTCGVELARRYHSTATGKTPEGLIDFVTWSKEVRTAWQFIPELSSPEAEAKIQTLRTLSPQFKKCVLTMEPQVLQEEGILTCHILDWMIG